MAILALSQVLEQIRREPLAHLTSRSLRSLNHYLSGRDLALAHLGIPGWSDLPIAERVEAAFAAKLMSWRNWIDIVEYRAADEWSAFDDFLKLAASWSDAVPAPPAVMRSSSRIIEVVDLIGQRPELYLGERSVFRFADFLKGYTDTVSSAIGSSHDTEELAAVLLQIEKRPGEVSNRPWFKVLRFNAATEAEAFDEFFRTWRARRT
jgi:hypothetical protein